MKKMNEAVKDTKWATVLWEKPISLEERRRARDNERRWDDKDPA